jgi:fucose 4-O-acetylase-like acetyltransferase
LGKGLFIGTAEVIDAATGMQSLWFLSTLFSVVLVLGIVKRLSIPMLFVVPLALVVHGLVGYLSEDVRLNIPFGLVSVGYIIVIGLILRMIFVQFGVEVFKKYSLAFALIWLVLQCFSTFYTQTRIGFSMMRFQSFQDVGALLLHDGLILCAMMFLITTTVLRSSRMLCYLGENSLQIYLFHHFIYGVLYTVLVQLDVVSGLNDPNALLYGVILYPLVLVASVVAVELVKKSGVQPYLFPRSLSALKGKFV